MIKGFETETEELTEYESTVLLPLIVKGLSVKIGQKNAVTNGKMRTKLQEKGYEVTDPRIRKIINYIRMNKLITNLLATSKGYYVSNDAKEIEDYKQSLISRANAILNIVKSYD